MKRPQRKDYATGRSGASKFRAALSAYRKSRRTTAPKDTRPFNRRGRRIGTKAQTDTARPKGLSNIPPAEGYVNNPAYGQPAKKPAVKPPKSVTSKPQTVSPATPPKPKPAKPNPYRTVTRSKATSTAVDPGMPSNPKLKTQPPKLSARQEMLNRRKDRLDRAAKKRTSSPRERMRARIARRQKPKKK